MLNDQPQYTITEADKDRQRQIAEAWKAYDGQFHEHLQIMEPSGVNPNANSNRIEPIVFSGVNFLAGKPIQFTVSPGSPEEAQTFLDDTWGGRTERRMPLIQDLATSGGIAGHAFLRIVPNQRAVESIESGVWKNGARLLLRTIDPITVHVQTARQDCKTVMLYCIQYSMKERANGKDIEIFYREEIQRIDPNGSASLGMPDEDDTWLMQSWIGLGDKGPWTPTSDQITWPFKFAPIFSCQNRSDPHDFWGKPDITPDLIRQNDDINLNQSDAQAVNTIYADPLIVASGAGESIIRREIGRIIQLPPDAKIEGVPLQTDLTNNLTFTASLRANMDEQSAVPAVALGRQADLPKGQISGVTLELLFMPLLAKTEMKRCRYGNLLVEVSEALLQMAGFSSDITVSIDWQNPLPKDEAQSWQYAPAQLACGVSKSTVLKERGYDPAYEAELRKQEDQEAMINFSRGQGLPPAGIPTPGQEPMTQQDGGHGNEQG